MGEVSSSLFEGGTSNVHFYLQELVGGSLRMNIIEDLLLYLRLWPPTCCAGAIAACQTDRTPVPMPPLPPHVRADSVQSFPRFHPTCTTLAALLASSRCPRSVRIPGVFRVAHGVQADGTPLSYFLGLRYSITTPSD
jgi:hypothetical protein